MNARVRIKDEYDADVISTCHIWTMSYPPVTLGHSQERQQGVHV
jgi:hypothetical protein